AERVVVGKGWRRHIIGPAPQHELLIAALGPNRRLVLTLQHPVVALVEAPRSANRNPQPIGNVQGDFGGANCASQHRCVDDVWKQVVLYDQLTAALGLGHSLWTEVDVDPSGEQILPVPVALAVAKQHQGGGHRLNASSQGVPTHPTQTLCVSQGPRSSAVRSARSAFRRRRACDARSLVSSHHETYAD